jgi:hypothetical protein
MSRVIQSREIYLNDKTLQDIVAAHLYAMNVVSDNQEVLSVTLVGDDWGDGCTTILFQTIENKEPELIIHT